ncbi:MAG TPA: Lrp/AsnC family transcriptional regulator, partial [Armatimonadota bacterium]|nr:Lrp/AsnC family transcriptional regulator [Armatimonadota bacterium]
ISHCYQRPYNPDWPYSVFTMIHGRTPKDCEKIARELSEATGITDYVLLYSTREFKKTRVQYYEHTER